MLKTAVSIAALMVAGTVSAQTAPSFAKPEEAVQYREGAMQVMKARFGVLAPVVKGQVPYDKEAVLKDVEIFDVVAKLPWAGFEKGTEGGNAKPDVWTNAEAFAQEQQKFLSALEPLTQAAKAGDFDNLRVAFGKVGASCKSCHDSFMKK